MWRRVDYMTATMWRCRPLFFVRRRLKFPGNDLLSGSHEIHTNTMMKVIVLFYALVVSRVVSSSKLFQYPDPLPTDAQEKVVTFLGSIQVGDGVYVPFTEVMANSSSIIRMGVHQLSLDGSLQGTLELGASSSTSLFGPFVYDDEAFFVFTRREANRGGLPKHTAHIIDGDSFSITKNVTLSGALKIDTIQSTNEGSAPFILFGSILPRSDELSLGLVRVDDSSMIWSFQGDEIGLETVPVIDGSYVHAVAAADDGFSSIVKRIDIGDGSMASTEVIIPAVIDGGGPLSFDKTNGYLYFITTDCDDTTQDCPRQISRVDTSSLGGDGANEAQVFHMSVPTEAENWIRLPVVLPDGTLACFGGDEIGVFNVSAPEDSAVLQWQHDENGGVILEPQVRKTLLIYLTSNKVVFQDFQSGDIQEETELDNMVVTTKHLHVTTQGSRIYTTAETLFSPVVYAYSSPIVDENSPTTLTSAQHRGTNTYLSFAMCGISLAISLWQLNIA